MHYMLLSMKLGNIHEIGQNEEHIQTYICLFSGYSSLTTTFAYLVT